MKEKGGGGDGKAGLQADSQSGVVAGQGAYGHVLHSLLGHSVESRPVQCRSQAAVALFRTHADQIQAAAGNADRMAEGGVHFQADEAFDPIPGIGHDKFEFIVVERIRYQPAVQ